MLIAMLVLGFVGTAGYLAYSTAAAKTPAEAGAGKLLWRLMRKQPA